MKSFRDKESSFHDRVKFDEEEVVVVVVVREGTRMTARTIFISFKNQDHFSFSLIVFSVGQYLPDLEINSAVT